MALGVHAPGAPGTLRSAGSEAQRRQGEAGTLAGEHDDPAGPGPGDGARGDAGGGAPADDGYRGMLTDRAAHSSAEWAGAARLDVAPARARGALSAAACRAAGH